MATKYLNLNLDTTLGGAASSDTTISSQKAVKTYVDTTIAGTSYTTVNPVLTPVAGVVEWTIEHNLDTTNVIGTVYCGEDEVWVNVRTIDSNTVKVVFNSNSNIPEGTYTAVIVTSGGIGTPAQVDDTLSSLSLNPVQNRVLYPSLGNFIPSGTTITVKTDGTGDYTTLKDAVSSLIGKWSNGSITINISNETYNTDEQVVVDGSTFNIPNLVIQGQGMNNTTLNFSQMYSGAMQIQNCTNNVVVKNFYIKCAGKNLTPGRGLNLQNCTGKVDVDSIKVSDSDAGICALVNSNARIMDCSLVNCNIGIWGAIGAREVLVSCTFNTVGTGVQLYKGAAISLEGTASFTNVTSNYSQALATTTANGVIYGSW